MKRGVLIVAAFAAAATTTACGGGDVFVQAVIEGQAAGGEQGEQIALTNLPVRLLPYDRDALFDSLTQAAAEPEPVLPDSVIALQDSVINRQREWQQLTNEWGIVRDSLGQIRESMDTLDESSGEYFALFQEFNALEERFNELDRESNQAFAEFEALQNRLFSQSQEIRAAQQAWADEVFAPVDSIILAREEASGLEERADTTDASGVARFRGVEPGQWWVHARYERQYDELYWNEPIEVVRGEDITLQLTTQNAEVRQRF